LREKVSPISLAVTIVGKMHTAKLKGEVLDREAAWQEGWLQMLQEGAAAARFVADEIDKARECLVMTPEEFAKAYDQASPEIQQIISDKIRAFKAKSETSDFPVNLPGPDVGQTVLNSAAGPDHEAPAAQGGCCEAATSCCGCPQPAPCRPPADGVRTTNALA
jgi:hypothetical protein